MLYKEICKILSKYLYGMVLILIIPTILAAYYQFVVDPADHPQPHSTVAFLLSMLITLALAVLCSRIGGKSRGFFPQEAFAAVIAIWFLTPAITGLPFILSNTLKNPLLAYFESTSGITTTGSTIIEAKKFDATTGKEIPIHMTIPGVIPTEYVYYGTIEPVRDPQTHAILYEGLEAISKAVLFWRSFLQWLGGLGIVLIFIAILPAIGVGGKFLFQTEISGPLQETVKPRIKETAGELWKIYFGLTILEIILLKITNSGMHWLDVFCVTFGTISTGGLCLHNGGIAYYNNCWTEWIIIVFMLLGSINFSLYYYAFRGKFYRFKQPEFWLFLAIVAAASLIAIWQIVGTMQTPVIGISKGVYSFAEAIRYGIFQVVSAITTTGYYTMNYDMWPYTAQTVILIVMFIGGMSGSTAGGMKVIRSYILFKLCQHKVESLFTPKAVSKVRVGTRELDMQSGSLVLCFFVILISFLVAAGFLLIMDGVDPETSFSVIASSVTNTGMGFRMISPERSFAFLSNFGMIVSSAAMIFGRLEFFAVLVLLLPSFWKQMKS